MLLGWIAGTLAVTDPAVTGYIPQTEAVRYTFGIAGALSVFMVGTLLARRAKAD